MIDNSLPRRMVSMIFVIVIGRLTETVVNVGAASVM